MDIDGIASSYMNYADMLTGSASGKTSQSISSLQNKDLSGASDDELMDVCKEFEAYFVEMVMKEMMKTAGSDELSSGANSTLVNYFKDSAISDLAKQSTEQNSLGLAQTLYEQMKRNYGTDTPVE